MRWLLLKDLQILRRSPLLLVLLVAYAVVIGLPVGYGVSAPPFKAIDPTRVNSREASIAKVRDGDALAALVVPAEIIDQLKNATELPGISAPPTLEVYFNADNPLKRRYVEGGPFSLPTGTIDVLGLKRAKTVLQGAQRGLPAEYPQRAAIGQVVAFADVAIASLDFANPVLGAIASPIRVDTTEVRGGNGSLEGFAIAAAVTIALMFVALLLGAGMLALEREEHAFGRLVRGLVRPTTLLAEKVVLGALGATLTGVVLLALLSAFEPVSLGRAPQWLAALVLGALAFPALGVAVGALTRDVRAASLLAFLVALPIAALALVPSGAVGAAAFDVIRVFSALFPFKATLDALDAGLNGSGGLGGPIVHLVVLAAAYTALARLALRRFAAR